MDRLATGVFCKPAPAGDESALATGKVGFSEWARGRCERRFPVASATLCPGKPAGL